MRKDRLGRNSMLKFRYGIGNRFDNWSFALNKNFRLGKSFMPGKNNLVWLMVLDWFGFKLR